MSDQWLLGEINFKKWVRDFKEEEKKLYERLLSIKERYKKDIFAELFAPSLESNSTDMVGYFIFRLNDPKFLFVVRQEYVFKRIIPISNTEAESIKQRAFEKKQEPEQKLFNVGDKVEIIDGPQKGLVGNILVIDGENLTIGITILESIVKVDTLTSCVKKSE